MLFELSRAVRILLLVAVGTVTLFCLVFVVPSRLLDCRLELVCIGGEEGLKLNPIGIAWAGGLTCIYGVAAGLLLWNEGVPSSIVILTASSTSVLTAVYLGVVDPAFLLAAMPTELAEWYTSFTRAYCPVLYRVYWEWAFWRYFPYFVLVYALGVFGVLWAVVRLSSSRRAIPSA